MNEEKRRRLTSGEAARILGVNVKTLRNWADKGYIDHVRTPVERGRRWFDLESLEAFAETMRRGKLVA